VLFKVLGGLNLFVTWRDVCHRTMWSAWTAL